MNVGMRLGSEGVNAVFMSLLQNVTFSIQTHNHYFYFIFIFFCIGVWNMLGIQWHTEYSLSLPLIILAERVW